MENDSVHYPCLATLTSHKIFIASRSARCRHALIRRLRLVQFQLLAPLAHSSEVEHSPDKTGVEGSLPSVPTNLFLEDRLMVGQQILDLYIRVRVLVLQPFAGFVYRFRIIAFHATETGSIPVLRTK